MYGEPEFFFALMLDNKSMVPAASKRFEIFSIKLSRTKFSISCLSTLVPISFSLRFDFIESITDVATSDSINAISS